MTEENYEEKIKQKCNTLAGLEKDGKLHKWSAIGRWVNDSRTEKEGYLDFLASLLIGNETCAAICLNKKRLLVSCNGDKVDKKVKDVFFRDLADFANNQTTENCEKLKDWAIEQIYFQKSIFKGVRRDVKQANDSTNFVPSVFQQKMNEITELVKKYHNKKMNPS